jgi:3-methyladenine DNA glycosylase AlkD
MKQTIRQLLEPNRNAEIARWQTSYMRDQFPFLGIQAPLLRSILQTLTPSPSWRADVKMLMEEPEREFHYAAIHLAIKMRKETEEQDIALYEEMVLKNSWWDTVDTIAPQLIGAHFHRFPHLLPLTEKWLLSDQLWLKRSALIYPLYQRKKIDAERLFRYCKELSQEKDFFIRKAIGWMLREYSKINPAAVLQFIEETPLSPLSKREGLRRIKIL